MYDEVRGHPFQLHIVVQAGETYIVKLIEEKLSKHRQLNEAVKRLL